ncbi:MAG: DUF427 domain-containing protein [Pseudomonadota bacterium]
MSTDKPWRRALDISPSDVAAYRRMRPAPPPGVLPEKAGTNEESVWDYPRPPEIRKAPAIAEVRFGGQAIAKSSAALRVCETAGAPVYYFPPIDVREDCLIEVGDVSVCEWKGAAVHFDVVVDGKRAAKAAFSYPDPFDDLGRGFQRIAGWYGFYPACVDACILGQEIVRSQEGGFYAGWVTDAIRGPIKGAAGSGGW